MKMRTFRRGVLAVALTIGTAMPQMQVAQASDAGAAIVGGIIGLGVGAAIAKSHKHKEVIYYPGYVPPYPPGGYAPAYARSYMPKGDVICYPLQRACYKLNGNFSVKWTTIEFG